MNTECLRIAEQLTETIRGKAGYGSSLQEILRDVSARQAQTYPIAGVHSIWQLLYHAERWVKFAIDALDGVPIPAWPGMPQELDWPPVTDKSESAWQQTLDSFFSQHLKLAERIKAFSDEQLESTVPGRTYNFYRLFHGTMQHSIYHAGQIALLKKFF
jgi:hypothetical protein